MGGGAWTTTAYNTALKNRGIADASTINITTVNQFYSQHYLDKALDPNGVKYRECCDSEEHPNTIPVILALDVTGSMGSACAAVARQLDTIITQLYEKVEDVEFMIMGIGDLAYDSAPLQVSQFESDVRILDHLGKIYFERGGGGNGWESYTAAWYYGARHTKLDCWNRGKKGIIITMGDEPLNPYLPAKELSKVLGYTVQGDIDTKELYEEVTEKYDVYHIIISDAECSAWHYMERDKQTWSKVLDGQHLMIGQSTELPRIITDIVTNSADNTSFVTSSPGVSHIDEEGIGW